MLILPRPRQLVPILVSIGLLLGSAIALRPPVQANLGPAPSSRSATGCVSYWYVSYSGTSNWTLINTDPDGLDLSQLRFDRGYSDPTDLSHGYLDFNGDGKSDIFSAVPRPDGNYQWRYSSSGTSPWINLAYDSTPPADVRFGDFNGDGYTDVFVAKPISGTNLLQWQYSPGGVGTIVNLAYADTPLSQLAFGDFNGDGRTDVFTLKDIGGGNFGWMVSSSGTSSYVQINSATTTLANMQFGDIDGDGHTDVFTTVPGSSPGTSTWLYSSAGTGAYQPIVTTNLSVSDVRLSGDFDGDHRSDFFYTSLRPVGNYQWWYFFYHQNPFAVGSTQLADADTPPDQLRFGDFNGDGVTDVFKLVRQCSTQVDLPIVSR